MDYNRLDSNHASPRPLGTTGSTAPLDRGQGELRAELARMRALLGSKLESEPEFDVGRAYATAYDGILGALFETCRLLAGTDPRLCLGAVGSYGRQTLSPKSDLDVRILCSARPEAIAPFAEALLLRLWDAGLDIGHQVVTPDELIELSFTDLTTATALLDWRPIAGDAALGEALIERAYAEVFRRERLGNFAERLEAYNRSRHERYGGSVYLLEPNVKNGAGGLRDLDVAEWCAKAAFRVGELSTLSQNGVLLEREYSELARARLLLTRIRNALHLSVGRKTDRLTFDQQECLARRLGYGADATAVERLMSEYYQSARTIRRVSEDLLSRLQPTRARPLVPLGAELARLDDKVTLREGVDLDVRPALSLTLYDTALEHDLSVSEAARRAVRRATAKPEFCERLRRDPEAIASFRRLVCTVRETRFGRGSPLRELHDVGLLLAMIPEFQPVVGRVHHDKYHVFTVDEHSLAAVDHLRKLVRGTPPQEQMACRLAAELPQRETLFFSALLHDVGKVLGAHGHAERGAKMAATILGRLGFKTPAVERAEKLIRLHLRMYLVATRRDIEDPRILRELCDAVGTEETLRELYLLTIADISTTGAGTMTAWTRTMLDTLAMHAERALAQRPGAVPPEPEAVTRDSVLALWPDAHARSFLRHFLSGLPDRYLLANDPESIVAHARFAQDVHTQRCAVRLGQERASYAEVWVVADDRPGLLALIAASFREVKFDVLSAQVYSWVGADGKTRSMDLFWVRHRASEAVTERHLARVRDHLDQLLSAEEPAKHVSSPPPALVSPSPFVETRVTLDNQCATSHTVVEVITKDRPDLLLRLSSALQSMGLSVWFAKLNTEGDRVADVFYVSDRSGRKVTDPLRLGQIEELLSRAAEETRDERVQPTFAESSAPAGAAALRA